MELIKKLNKKTVYNIYLGLNCARMLNKMKNVLFILTILIFIISCRNYESKEYFDNENQAISDIILAMTEFDKMKRLNEWSDIKLKLYVVAELDTISAWTEKPKGYTIAINDVSLSKKGLQRIEKDMKMNWLNMKKRNFYLEI